ncbi:toll/interleukin-1 receptor domain-containing protein [Conexibacter woesei]|uniref:toll/interleukin-1 receptor domain-containing protein n=1 Tax=Conexibacter woesei TaxID=191495 RepID=UPI001E282A0C|nr:toll/interleukin-1 receptor domain-containing protein [Conexibacter woesei]
MSAVSQSRVPRLRGRERPPRVFICYRRDDTRHLVSGLAAGLASSMRGSRIFVDRGSIPIGAVVQPTIEEEIESSDVVLAVIGPGWLTITGPDGSRRLDDPRDYVHAEIAAALRRGKHVIPVLVDGASMPLQDELPPEIAELAGRQAKRLHDDGPEEFAEFGHQLTAAVRSFRRRQEEQRQHQRTSSRRRRLPGLVVIAITLCFGAGLGVAALVPGDSPDRPLTGSLPILGAPSVAIEVPEFSGSVPDLKRDKARPRPRPSTSTGSSAAGNTRPTPTTSTGTATGSTGGSAPPPSGEGPLEGTS